MAKAHTETDFVQPVTDAAGGEIPVLYGNENFVHDRPRGRAGRDAAAPTHTQEEWLVEAGEVVAVMERGDAVSHETVKMLFLDAYDVIEGFTPPAARDSKKKDADDDDKNHKRQEK